MKANTTEHQQGVRSGNGRVVISFGGDPDHDVVGTYTYIPTTITLANSKSTSNYTITYRSSTYEITAGLPAKLTVPAFVTDGAPFGAPFLSQPVVTVRDQKDNVILTGAASTGTVTATISQTLDASNNNVERGATETLTSSGTAVTSLTATAADGVARFSGSRD